MLIGPLPSIEVILRNISRKKKGDGEGLLVQNYGAVFTYHTTKKRGDPRSTLGGCKKVKRLKTGETEDQRIQGKDRKKEKEIQTQKNIFC